MLFSVSRASFLKALQRVVGVVGRRPTMPILSHVLLSRHGNILSLTGTDLDLELISRIEVKVEGERDREGEGEREIGGEITLPAKKLLDICRSLPEGSDIDFSIQDTDVAIIKAGKSRFRVVGLNASDFPTLADLPESVQFSLKSQDLKTLLDHTAFAMAQQDIRYYLNGLLLRVEPELLCAVGADGHRLAVCSLRPETMVAIAESAAMIIPRKAVVEIQRLFSEENAQISVMVGATHLRFTTTDCSFCTKLIDSKFPDYTKLLLTQPHFEVMIDRLLFKQCLQRVAVLFLDQYRAAALHLEPNLIRIIAVNAQKDQVEEELEVSYTGDPMVIGFNVNYLLDYVNVVSTARIVMKVINPHGSVVLEPVALLGMQQLLYLVMPVKL